MAVTDQKKILVVDDDPKIRTLLRRCFETGGYTVEEAADSKAVAKILDCCFPDLITLDLSLGVEDGLDIARDIRKAHDVPIIMVTGKDDVIDRIVGLELGADDYLTKPFHVREVLARVRAVLRRTEGRTQVLSESAGEVQQNVTLLDLDGLKIGLDSMLLIDRAGQNCELTTADFKLLAAFLKNPKKPLSRDRLMDLIGGHDWAPLDRTIDNQVARLRKKIERDVSRPLLIKTVRGLGYMLTQAAADHDDRSSSTA